MLRGRRAAIITIRRDRAFIAEDRTNRLLRVAGPDAADGAAAYRDASVHVARLEAGAEVVHRLGAGRGAYVYLIEGAASFDREDVATGDAAEVTDQPEIVIRAWQASELILVDLPITPPTGRQPGEGSPLP
jgi:redox-sensitive bicupin YhaK (pirin superfamily)